MKDEQGFEMVRRPASTTLQNFCARSVLQVDLLIQDSSIGSERLPLEDSEATAVHS